jgi:hypothetical protein
LEDINYAWPVCFVGEALLVKFSPGESMRMKRLTAVLAAGILIFSLSLGMAQTQQSIGKEFGRATYFSGIKLTFVLLTNKGIDLLFPGAGKDMVKEKASQGTTFYVSGTAEKNITLNTNFIVEQGEDRLPGMITNVKNFVDGPLAKGEKVSALMQVGKKLNLNKPFTIKGTDGFIDFQLSDDALRMVP